MKKLILLILSLMPIFLLAGCDNYKEENNQLNKQIEEYKGLIENLDSQILLMVEIKNTMDTLIYQLENNIENLNYEKENLENENSQILYELGEATRLYNSYKEISKDMEITIDNYKDDIISLEEEKILLETEKENLAAEINRMVQASYELITTYELTIDGLEEEIEILSRLLDEDLINIKDEILSLQAEIASLYIFENPIRINGTPSGHRVNDNDTRMYITGISFENMTNRTIWYRSYTITMYDTNGYAYIWGYDYYISSNVKFYKLSIYDNDNYINSVPNFGPLGNWDSWGSTYYSKNYIAFLNVPIGAKFSHIEITYK